MARPMGTLRTWSQRWSAIYLQERNKHIHDAEEGGGDQAIPVHTVLKASMHKVTASVSGKVQSYLVASGTMKKVTAAVVGTD